MAASAPRLVVTGLLPIPGRAGALAVASASGLLAAGDDRGEAGVWTRDGVRAAAFRLRTPVVWADIECGTDRAAFVGADGEAALVGGSTPPVRFRVAPGDRVLLDRTGPGSVVVRPSGRVEVRDAAGRALRGFDVPGPVAGVAPVARIGGIATITPQGMVARVTPWGALVWGGDYRMYAAGAAADAKGEVLVLCLLSHGAEILQASSGARLGVLDVGRPVQCAAVSQRHILLGTADGALALFDRQGGLLAECRTGSKVRSVAVADDGAAYALLENGLVRSYAIEGAAGVASLPPAVTIEGWRRPLAVSVHGVRAPLVAVSPRGTRIAAADGPRRVVVTDADGSLVAEGSHDGPLVALAADDDGVAWAVTSKEIRRIDGVSSEPARRFAGEWGLAAWSPDGLLLAGVDEMCEVRTVSRTTATDVAEGTVGRGGCDALLVSATGAAARVRTGDVFLLGPAGPRLVRLPACGVAPRVEACVRDGAVVVLGSEVGLLGWDGTLRTVAKLPAPPEAVRALATGALVIVSPDGLRTVLPDARVAAAAVARPQGRFAGLSDGDRVVLAWMDGRRLAFTTARGAPVAERTFESRVASVALSRHGGLAAILLEGGVLTALRIAGACDVPEAGTGHPADVRIASVP